MPNCWNFWVLYFGCNCEQVSSNFSLNPEIRICRPANQCCRASGIYQCRLHVKFKKSLPNTETLKYKKGVHLPDVWWYRYTLVGSGSELAKSFCRNHLKKRLSDTVDTGIRIRQNNVDPTGSTPKPRIMGCTVCFFLHSLKAFWRSSRWFVWARRNIHK